MYPVIIDGRAAWVGGLRGVAKLDADTGASLSFTGAIEEVTGIAAGEGSVWLTNANDPEVVRLNAETGAVEARIPLGGFGEDLVLRRGLIWVVVPPTE